MDDDSESSQDSSSSRSTCDSVPTPPRNHDPPSSPVQVTTDIDSELFQRLQPVHYIILSILKEETPVSLLPVCQDLYSELAPTLYKTFVLDKDTYRDKMRGAYNRRLVIKNGDEKLEYGKSRPFVMSNDSRSPTSMLPRGFSLTAMTRKPAGSPNGTPFLKREPSF
ncbi:hypothetical protein I316_03474 [Kwoniella heveanensis BCC8398]|uniref:Uncharacterized protein n=1 Tax=Kwoniella heveanensis BCC8398 TaxID=1296120 RepID=A0A1B9GV72_9TREE|nr:hypothetical protein I316_03474 [Kwoniella heveanensis BCC8398]